MGRLFQYNRFGGSELAAEDNAKDAQTTGGWKNNKVISKIKKNK